LRIKRKTRRNGASGRITWWFVIHADEALLSELDEKWDSVHVQTSWTISQCTKPADTEEAPTSNTPPLNSHERPSTPSSSNSEPSGLHQDAESEDTSVSEDANTLINPSFLDHAQDHSLAK
jgi:hypothetical protein